MYAENSVKHILTGKAYARAVRGHTFTHAAIAYLVFSEIEFTEQEKATVKNLRQKFGVENMFDQMNNNSVYRELLKNLIQNWNC